jgi:hypothetical protein
MPWLRLYFFVSLFILSVFKPIASIASTCRPIASAPAGTIGKPEVCAPLIVRDELLIYMNLGEIYRLDPENEETRFVDRVELISDLAQNGYYIGNGLAVLKMNSFLRIRDAKLFLDDLKKRISLVKASAETSKLLTELILAGSVTKLNVDAPLKDFLDGPFIGEAGNVIVAAQLEHRPQDNGVMLKAEPIANLPSPSSAADCKALRHALKERRDRLADQFSDLKKAQSQYGQWLAESPVGASRSNNASDSDGKVSALAKKSLISKGNNSLRPQSTQSTNRTQSSPRPTELAQAIASSECDQCFEAVHYCKARGLIDGYIPTPNNCSAVRKSTRCYDALPASLSVPVEICYGVPRTNLRASLKTPLDKWRAQSTAIETQISALDKILDDTGPGGCVDPK